MSVTPGLDPSIPVYPEKPVDALTPTATPEWVPIEQGGYPSGEVDPDNVVYPEIDTTLLPGVPGQRGPRGPQGPPGDGALQYTQSGAATIWQITHNLGFKPNVRVQDSAGTDIEGDVHYNSNNAIQINFSTAITGIAYLS